MADAKHARPTKAILVLVGYQVALALAALVVNVLAFDFSPVAPRPPHPEVLLAASIGIAALLLNHGWLMTATELARAKHGLYATPEELEASGAAPGPASTSGLKEVERTHNAHRNTTENTVYFALATAVFVFLSPSPTAVWLWVLAYPLARLGYTYAYLTANTGLRGLCMSVGLLGLYGSSIFSLLTLIEST